MSLVLFLGARYLFIFSFKLLQIYPRFPLNSKLFGFRILLAWFVQEDILLFLLSTEPILLGFFIFAPTLVTRTNLCVTLTSVSPLFFSKVLNSSVDTWCRHPTYPSATRSSNVHRVWLCNLAVRKLLWFWYYRGAHNKTLNSSKVKSQNDNCMYIMGNLSAVIHQLVLQSCSDVVPYYVGFFFPRVSIG